MDVFILWRFCFIQYSNIPSLLHIIYKNFLLQKGSVLVKKCAFSCNASSTYSGDYTTPISEEEGASQTTENYDYGLIEPDAFVIFLILNFSIY